MNGNIIYLPEQGSWYIDTPVVQALVTKYGGQHTGFGDFTFWLNCAQVWLTRIDNSDLGDRLKADKGFIGRPHRVDYDTDWQDIRTTLIGISHDKDFNLEE